MNTNTFEKIVSVIVEVLRVEPQQVQMQARIREDLGADSVDIVSLLMALEEHFQREISDEEAAGLSTVGDVYNYIEKVTSK